VLRIVLAISNQILIAIDIEADIAIVPDIQGNTHSFFREKKKIRYF